MAKDRLTELIDALAASGSGHGGSIPTLAPGIDVADVDAAINPLRTVSASGTAADLLAQAARPLGDVSQSASFQMSTAIEQASAGAPGANPQTMVPTGSISTAGADPDVERLSGQIEQLVNATAQQIAVLEDNTQAVADAATKQTTAASSDGNPLTKLFSSTLGSMFGLSPIITGLASLFGGGDDTPDPLVKFAMPQTLQQDAGLSGDNQFTTAVYGENGLAKETSSSGAPSGQQINIQVQAMDSRSFLDRSDDIARAVKDAMLYSHPLNDVIADL